MRYIFLDKSKFTGDTIVSTDNGAMVFALQNPPFCSVKEPVLKRKASSFVMHWSLSCYAAAILRTFFCAFSAIHSSSNYILSSHLAEYIYTIRQCARPYRSVCLA